MASRSIISPNMNTTGGSSDDGYLIPSDGYVVIGFLIFIIAVIAAVVIAEASVPLMRGHFVNNIGAVVLTAISIAIVWYYTGKRVRLFRFSINAGYVAYVVIIAILVVAFSG